MSDTQYYSFVLQIPKDTFIRINAHRLTNNISEDNGLIGKDLPEIVTHPFGGKYGTQFSNTDQIEAFLRECHRIFAKHEVDIKHLHPILYIMLFLQEDDVQQSLDRNRFNRLLEYARFIMDLVVNCSSHMRMMLKNEAYERVYDEYTTEYFFAKRELVSTMEHEELLEFIPDEDKALDVVKYMRVPMLNKEIYVPNDLLVTINSIRELRNVDGEVISQLDLPLRFRHEMLCHTIDKMISDHKSNNTLFYQELSKEVLDESELKRIYKLYRKRAFSQNRALAKVATIIADYLNENSIRKTKPNLSKFLFEYFALFKVFRLKTHDEIPDTYADLVPFYLKRGINGETVRNIMKDVGEI